MRNLRFCMVRGRTTTTSCFRIWMGSPPISRWSNNKRSCQSTSWSTKKTFYSKNRLEPRCKCMKTWQELPRCKIFGSPSSSKLVSRFLWSWLRSINWSSSMCWSVYMSRFQTTKRRKRNFKESSYTSFSNSCSKHLAFQETWWRATVKSSTKRSSRGTK